MGHSIVHLLFCSDIFYLSLILSKQECFCVVCGGCCDCCVVLLLSFVAIVVVVVVVVLPFSG